MKTKNILNVVILVGMLASGLVLNSQAGHWQPNPSPAPTLSAGPHIHLAAGTFDPLADAEPMAIDELYLSAYPADGQGYYLVQFQGPITPSDITALKSVGAEIFDYVPDFAFIVKMDAATQTRLSRLESIRWLGVYQPAYRVAANLLQQTVNMQKDAAPIELVLSIFKNEPLTPLTTQIEAWGGVILEQSQTNWKSKLKIAINPARLASLAAIDGIRWIEAAPQWQLTNSEADNILSVRDVWERHGLYGAGQIVAVCDTGLDQGSVSPELLHDDFEDGHGNSRVLALYDWVGKGDGASDIHSGHGTHVAGSVLGSGALSGADPAAQHYPETAYVGMAPEANLILQAIEDKDSFLSGVPLDLNELFAQAADDGASIHSNSWGDGRAGHYTSYAQDVDEFVWEHKDFTILFSAGNAGYDKDADGLVDLASIGPPSTAKNCIAVGASENYRPVMTDTWGGWPSLYPAEPLYSDLVAEDPDGMAAFSSRGPTLDGRYKPDVVAPGTFVASARSSLAYKEGWGVIDENYVYMGGTSMSTPLVAGTAALVRQYYSDREGITPSAALLKATLVNGATNIAPGQYGIGNSPEISTTRPTNVAGWGRVNLENSIFAGGSREMIYTDQSNGLQTSQTHTYTYQVTDAAEPLRVTLAWSDYPGSPAALGGLVNDLDLKVLSPNGSIHYPNNAAQPSANTLLFYDNLWPTDSYQGGPNKRIAVRFTPLNYPATLQSASFFILTHGSYPLDFNYYVYDGNSVSGPQNVLASGSGSYDGQSWDWPVVDLSPYNLTIESGDFFIAVELPDEQAAWFSDSSAPVDGRSWLWQDGAWSQQTDTDYMFNAVVSREVPPCEQDRINNLVGVDVLSPASGEYTVTVSGYNVPFGPQPYALVVSGGFGDPNTPPVLNFDTLPKQFAPAGGSVEHALDLWSYASDANDELTFDVASALPSSVRVTLEDNRYVNITSTLGFTGAVNIVAMVADSGGLTATDTFSVHVTNANITPTLDLPPLTFWMNAEIPPLDLWQYTQDRNDNLQDLTFTLGTSATVALSGSLVITDEHYMLIALPANWVGIIQEVVWVHDPGGLSATDLLHVTVAEQKRIYLPVILR